MVLPNVKPAEASFTLRRCLSESIRTELSFYDDHIDDILSRLDEKYADPAKLLDCIVSEIQRFKRLNEGDSRKFICGDN